MIDFTRFQLANGLKIIVHEDDSTLLATLAVAYDVGSRDEHPEKTGFAHLFEHLMFGGSKNISDFDTAIQTAGGENNAFTNTDLTCFYNSIPYQNLETLFWLESDRMLQLKLNKKSLAVQRKVVVEEFKETCLNQPYGDCWHHLLGLAYTTHPYRWPTIGKDMTHIQNANLTDVQDFFAAHYRPNNAVVVVAGNVKLEQVKQLAEKWFAPIPAVQIPPRNLPAEPKQMGFREKLQVTNVPLNAIYAAFHSPAQQHADHYTSDLLSDILANGKSARLFRRLRKEQRIFSDIDASITGTADGGLFIIEGKVSEGVSFDAAEKALWHELFLLKNEDISQEELQKNRNKVESSLLFSECNVMNKAINLAYYEIMGSAEQINEEIAKYEQITPQDLRRVSNDIFTMENCSMLRYEVK